MKTAYKVLIGGGIAALVGTIGYLFYKSSQTNALIQSNATQQSTNTAAVASASGSTSGYLQDEINQLQLDQALNQTNPTLNFQAPQLGSIAAPNLPSSISVNNQAPTIVSTPENNNSAVQSGVTNASASGLPQPKVKAWTGGF